RRRHRRRGRIRPRALRAQRRHAAHPRLEPQALRRRHRRELSRLRSSIHDRAVDRRPRSHHQRRRRPFARRALRIRSRCRLRAIAMNVIHADGAMSSRVETLVAISDPALYAAQALRDALHHAGIDVRGALRVNTTRRAWSERVAVIESPTLATLLAVMLKASQNLYAEMLLKDAGGGTYADAFELEKRFAVDEA